MSYVTGMVLVWCCEDERYEGVDNDGGFVRYDVAPPIAALNAFLREHGYEEDIVDQSYEARGAKHPQYHVYTAGHNSFPEDAFAQVFLAAEWENPERAILVMQPEDGPTRVFRPPYEHDEA